MKMGRVAFLLFITISTLIESSITTRLSYSNNKNDKAIETSKTNSQDLFNRTNVDQSTILKGEMRRYLKECGADVSSEENDQNRNFSYDRGYNQNGYRSRDYGSNYNNHRDDGNDAYNSNSNRRNYGSYDSNSNNGREHYSSDNGNTNRRNYFNSDSNYNQNNRRGYGESYDRNADFRHNNYNPYMTDSSTYSSLGSQDRGGYGDHFDRRYGENRDTYSRIRYSLIDSKREYRKRKKRSEDTTTECIAQCTFGALQLVSNLGKFASLLQAFFVMKLDNNRSPSESAFIKWIQDNLPNDVKRIKALRETRKCFAKLATTDNEDGCEFAKSLANCLNLNIDK